MNTFRKKSLSLCALSLFTTFQHETKALPIMNENVASNGLVVIYPDHLDSNRYYIAPNVVEVAHDESGRPHFSYTETRNGIFGKHAIMQMMFLPRFTQEDLAAAKAGILSKNPKAEFSALPFVESNLELTGDLKLLVIENQCSHKGGVVGQLLSCSLTLTPQGRRVWREAVERQKIFMTLQFDYTVMGVARMANGSFSDQVIQHGVAAVINPRSALRFRNQLINIQ